MDSIFAKLIVEQRTFTYIKTIDLDELANYELNQLSSALPFLVKLLLNSYFTKRKQVLKLLYHHARTNDIIHFMQAKVIEPSDIIPNGEDKTPLDVIFESGSYRDRLRVVAIEYLKIQDIARQTVNSTPGHQGNTSIKLQKSWLLDNPIYAEDVALCLYSLLNKPTTIPVINLLDMCEALLYVRQGPNYIAYLVSNSPDRCHEVCHYLITLGEKFDEGAISNEISDQRAKAVRMLCRMDPKISYRVQRLVVQLETMPSLALMITVDKLEEFVGQSGNQDLDENKDGSEISYRDIRDKYESAIAFMTGILLGEEESKRVWFAQYLKSAQKRIESNQVTILSRFRALMLTVIQRLQINEMDEISSNSMKEMDDSSSEESGDESPGATSLRQKLIQIIATLRYFCALRGVGMLKLENEESEALLNLITSKPPASQTSVIFATVGVCTLLVCSSMIHNQKEEKRAAEWLKWLIRESGYNDASYSGHGRCSISELLLLIAIHFQNNQTNQVAELVCATMGMKLQIKASVSKCKSLFVHEVFNDQMITEHAVKVPVTNGLDNTYTEFLPIHCIHQLLESRSFSKHQVPIQNWIYKQICQSKKPIHHMLPKLIEAYVNSVVVSTSVHGHCGTNQPIPSEFIARIFKTCLYTENQIVHAELKYEQEDARPQKKKKRTKKERSPEPMEICEQSNGVVDDGAADVVDYEVAQVLLLYYLTLYEDVRLKKGGDLAPADRAKLIRYSPEFMLEVPVFYLIQLVRDNQEMLGAILPYLLKLVASQYPHLCSIQHWLNTTDHYEPYRSRINETTRVGLSVYGNDRSLAINGRGSRLPPLSSHHLSELHKELSEGFKRIYEEPLILARVVYNITNLPRHEIWTCVDVFINNWYKILSLDDNLEHQRLVEVITRLWWKLNTIFPRRLWVMTTNSLQKSPTNGFSSVETRSFDHTWNDLTSDPLIVLRCDSRVFRHPPMLNIVLHVLNGFLAATKRCLQDQIYEQTTRQRDRNLEELRTTLVLAQTSAAIQILLESCIPDEVERGIINKRESGEALDQNEQTILKNYDTSVDSICHNLHQVFIADTNLAKLVHFQTYPSELLAITSNKIPSMHICLDFIPELLSQPDLSRQVFVIELTSHLCEKYAITKSLNVAKLCFNVAFTLLQLLPSDKRAIFYTPVLPALLRICKVFPILHEDARIILGQINQITLAHMASTSSRLSLGSSQPFDGLDKMSWHEIDRLMQGLTLNEALFLCIKKCLLDTGDMVS